MRNVSQVALTVGKTLKLHIEWSSLGNGNKICTSVDFYSSLIVVEVSSV